MTSRHTQNSTKSQLSILVLISLQCILSFLNIFYQVWLQCSLNIGCHFHSSIFWCEREVSGWNHGGGMGGMGFIVLLVYDTIVKVLWFGHSWKMFQVHTHTHILLLFMWFVHPLILGGGWLESLSNNNK